jgi:hypothetical protein
VAVRQRFAARRGGNQENIFRRLKEGAVNCKFGKASAGENTLPEKEESK